MMKRRHRSNQLMLLLVLITGLLPRPAHADDGSQQKPFRLYATAAFGPIGMANSLGTMAINSRRVQGQQPIWDGDLIETLADTTATVSLGVAGQVTILSGSTVRLATKPAEIDEDIIGHVLVVSLYEGDIAVRLKQDASAYVEAGDSAYTALRGSDFRIEVREGRAKIHDASDAVIINSQRKQARIVPRGVSGRRLGPTGNEQVNLNTKERTELKALIEKISSGSTTRLVSYSTSGMPRTQADEVRERLASRLVHFTVNPPTLGFIVDLAGNRIDTALTDSNGVVTVYFQAGSNQGRGQVIADIPLTPAEITDSETRTTSMTYTWEINVRHSFFRTRNKIIFGAAAAVIVGCCVIPRPTTPPLQQNPPPVVQPSAARND